VVDSSDKSQSGVVHTRERITKLFAVSNIRARLFNHFDPDTHHVNRQVFYFKQVLESTSLVSQSHNQNRQPGVLATWTGGAVQSTAVVCIAPPHPFNASHVVSGAPGANLYDSLASRLLFYARFR